MSDKYGTVVIKARKDIIEKLASKTKDDLNESIISLLRLADID